MNLHNPFAIGNTAEIYLLDKKVIKLFKSHLPPSEAVFEAKKQQLAYSYGLTVPNIIEITEISGRQAIIMEYIEGKTLGELLVKNLEFAKYYMNIFIDVQRKIHKVAVSTDDLESMNEKLKRKITIGTDLSTMQKDSLIKTIDSLSYEIRLCHGDFHPFNLIMKNDKVTIIDWVDAHAGDISADVARTYLLLSQSTTELANIYINSYCQKSDLTKEEIEKWMPVMAGAMLSELSSNDNDKKDRLLKIIAQFL